MDLLLQLVQTGLNKCPISTKCPILSLYFRRMSHVSLISWVSFLYNYVVYALIYLYMHTYHRLSYFCFKQPGFSIFSARLNSSWKPSVNTCVGEHKQLSVVKEIQENCIFNSPTHMFADPLNKPVKSSYPARQICRKSIVEECIFDYMALHIECRFNKNSLLQCYFLAILPAG